MRGTFGAMVAIGGFLFAGYLLWSHLKNYTPAEYQGNRSSTDIGRTIDQVRQRVSHVTEAPAEIMSAIPAKAAFTGAIHYSPAENLEQIDREVILSSRCNHLDVAAYALTDWQVVQAIVEFANSGRPVRIYRDYDQYVAEHARGSYSEKLFSGNPHIAIRVKDSHVLMHFKSYSDGCVLRDGSANLSPSGEKQQDNSLILTTDPSSIARFEQDFNAMWNRADNFVVQ